MSAALSESAVAFACNRVEDFARVQHARGQLGAQERTEATLTWLSYIGLDADRINQLSDWLDSFSGSGWQDDVLVGFAVGVLATQYEYGQA